MPPLRDTPSDPEPYSAPPLTSLEEQALAQVWTGAAEQFLREVDAGQWAEGTVPPIPRAGPGSRLGYILPDGTRVVPKDLSMRKRLIRAGGVLEGDVVSEEPSAEALIAQIRAREEGTRPLSP